MQINSGDSCSVWPGPIGQSAILIRGRKHPISRKPTSKNHSELVKPFHSAKREQLKVQDSFSMKPSARSNQATPRHLFNQDASEHVSHGATRVARLVGDGFQDGPGLPVARPPRQHLRTYSCDPR